MPNLKIDEGTIRLSINGDESRIVAFNPKDELFAEKVYRLITDYHVQVEKFAVRAEELDSVNIEDDMGLPANMQERLDLLKEVCNYMREQIDSVFGQGTSQTVFGDAYVLDAFAQFFDGVAPYIKSARTEKVQKYLPPKKPRRRK